MRVTYAHRRQDTGQVFYIGKGSLRRAYEQRGHNRHWNAVSKKYGYSVEILAEWDTDQEAFAHEKFLIACFKDLGHPLTNATEGGEGLSGWTWSAAQRKKLIASLTGRQGTFAGRKHTLETRQLISQKLKGKPGPRLGVRLADEEKLRMSVRAKAQFASEEARAAQRKFVQHQMRPVIAGGQTFESVHAFAKAARVPLTTAHRWVSRAWQDKLDEAATRIGGQYDGK